MEHLWAYLEFKIRTQFLASTTFSELKTALQYESLNITQNTVHDLYVSIPRRIQCVLKGKGVQSPINKEFLLFLSYSYFLFPHLCVHSMFEVDYLITNFPTMPTNSKNTILRKTYLFL